MNFSVSFVTSVASVLFLSSFQASQQYTNPNLIVTTDWLAAHLRDDNVRIIDMRTRGFDEGRIPGASLMANDLIRIANRPPHFLPTVEEFEQLMTRFRVTNKTRVV